MNRHKKQNIITTSLCEDVYRKFQLMTIQTRMCESELFRHIIRCGVYDRKEETPYYCFDIPTEYEEYKWRTPHLIQTQLCDDDYKEFLITCMKMGMDKTNTIRRIVNTIVIETELYDTQSNDNLFLCDIETLESLVKETD